MCPGQFRIDVRGDRISDGTRHQSHHYAVSTCDLDPFTGGVELSLNAAGFWTYEEAFAWAYEHGYEPTWDTISPLDYSD